LATVFKLYPIHTDGVNGSHVRRETLLIGETYHRAPNGGRAAESNAPDGPPAVPDRVPGYWPAAVTCFVASFWFAFFTYTSSHATQRAHWSRIVSRVAGPWSSYGYM